MSEIPTPPPQIPQINLAKVSRDDLVSRDIFGRTILHLLILTNRFDLLRNLLKNPEVKLVLNSVDFENGWNCFHYTIFHKKLSCFKVLIEYFRNNVKLTLLASLMELLKTKDRNGLTPLQLLNNDFKDLLWIPEYVDENDEIFLVNRWQEEETVEGQEEERVEGQEVQQGAQQVPNQVAENVTPEIPGPIRTDTGPLRRETPGTNEPTRPVIIKKPNHIPFNPKRGGSEVYMYGSNSNHQLGLGDSKDRSTPSRLSHTKFKKETSPSIQNTFRKPRYTQIALSKNHSVVTTTNGEIFSCGIGSRGRLGSGDLSDKFGFEKIDLENVTKVKISKNHSLALTSNNELYSWGLNSFNQLGYSSAGKNYLDRFESSPFLIAGELRKNTKPILGISCSKIHSLAFTANEIYSWGLNIGQMGYPALHQDIEFRIQNLVCKGEIQSTPKCISMRDEIKFVDTCELYTVVVTKKNDVHIYYQYQHFKLPKIQSRGEKSERERGERGEKERKEKEQRSQTREQSSTADSAINQPDFQRPKSHLTDFDIFKPTCLTKPIQIIKLVSKSNDSCTLLLDNGDLISFKFNANDFKSTKYTTLWKAYDKDMIVTDFDVGFDGSIILCTRNGSVFVRSKAGMKLMGNLAEILPTPNKFRKLQNLNKVVKVTCDGNFLSFGFIRDDIDALPLKLKKNDFFEDLEYLSCLVEEKKAGNEVNRGEAESYQDRKQFQLIKGDFHDSYITRFVYPKEEDGEESAQPDLLKNKLNLRYTGAKEPNIQDTFEISRSVDDDLRHALSDSQYISYKFDIENPNSKGFDCFIIFEKYPKISIGVHRHILKSRSATLDTIFNLSPTETFISSSFEAVYQPNKIVIKSSTNIASILILLHFIYSSKVCDIWSSYSSRHLYPPHIKRVKDEYDELVQIFKVSDILSEMRGFIDRFLSLDEGDVTFELKDGQLRGYSYLLKARSAFFETLLTWSEILGEEMESINDNQSEILEMELETSNELPSEVSSFNSESSKKLLDEQETHNNLSQGKENRGKEVSAQDTAFDSSLNETISAFAHHLKISTVPDIPPEVLNESRKTLNFNGLTVSQFTIILKHIYGSSDSDIFNHFHFKFEESDDFINELLELIEISDELLLFQLKALCQLAIIDFISLENVVNLLTHADFLSATKLFLNCCWYIYNNLEILLFDGAFLELPFEILKKLEKQVEIFQACKLIDFVANGKRKESSNWFESKSNLLLGKFMSNKSEFNELFISDRRGFSAFEPLVDVKFESSKPKEGKKRVRKSRKSSTLNTDIADFRNSIGVERDSGSVVEEVEEFEVVKKGGRRKSRVDRMSQSPPPPAIPAITETPSPAPSKDNSTSTSRSSSIVGINSNITQFPSLSQAREVSQATSTQTKDLLPAKETVKVTFEAGLSPYSNWASKSSSNPILTDKSPSSSGIRVSLNGSNSDWTKKSTSKIKIGPIVKLSQKERKKLAATPIEVKEEVKEEIFNNPWSVGGIALSSSSLDLTEELPVLGSSRDKKKAKAATSGRSETSRSNSVISRSNSVTSKSSEMSRFYCDTSRPYEVSSTARSSSVGDGAYTPSLTEIMIEESLKVERAKLEESERKTLLEVQQEQEFAKWWEEETLRVQKQMGLVNITETGTIKKAEKLKRGPRQGPDDKKGERKIKSKEKNVKPDKNGGEDVTTGEKKSTRTKKNKETIRS